MIDLHSHLGSSTKPSLLWRLAHDKGLRLIQKDYFEFEESLSVKKNISHDEYVTTLFRQTQRIQAGPNAVQECIIAAVATNYIKFGVRQLELRMNPMFRNENMIDLDFIFLAACYGLQKAKKFRIQKEKEQEHTKE
jgi:adenosine deaminase